MELHWIVKKFEELTSIEIYAIMQLRNEVFVVEQNCVYQDADNKDIASYHLMAWQGNKLVAYTRLLPPGLSYTEPSIGRVVTSASVRGNGTGRLLMQHSIAYIKKLFGNSAIKIGAQYYLKNFYSSLQFKQTSEIYLEDNIEHIEMLLEATNS